MHRINIKKAIQKIVDDGDRREMEELSDILEKVAGMIYDYDEKEGKKLEMCLYEMAYRKKANRRYEKRMGRTNETIC